ncbi:MAG: alpha/beta hydrolase [Rhodospirillales bacterium]|nr:alpha/beta hydrolase [Rhodospirillales bacterium]
MSLKSLLADYGRNAIPFVDPLNPERPLTLNTYRPAGHTPDCAVVIVQHGMNRNGDDYRDFWIPAADRHGLLIVAPTFARAEYPETEDYNNGLVFDADGSVRPHDAWVFAIPGRVIAALRQAGVMKQPKARIYGHSAGGQFVHRMISTHGGALFKAAIAANAGWYSLPTLEKTFPEGLGGLGLGVDELQRLFAYPLHILAGIEDCNANADNLPSQPEAQAQGPGRLHRARNYFARGRETAEKHGLPFNWRLTEVPGIAHDGCAMSAAAAGLWFEGQLPEMAAPAAVNF